MLLNMIIGFFYLFVGSVIGCNYTAINSCTTRLADQNVQTIGMQSMPTRDQLEHVCPILKEYVRCYDKAIASCGSSAATDMTVGVLENTVQFMCVTGKEDILRYSDCWQKQDVISGMRECEKKSQYDILIGGASGICSALDKAQNCFYTVIYNRCVYDATTVISAMCNTVYSPIRRHLICNGAGVTTLSPVKSSTEADIWWQRPRTTFSPDIFQKTFHFTTPSQFANWVTNNIDDMDWSNDKATHLSCDSMSLRTCILTLLNIMDASDGGLINSILKIERRHTICSIYPAAKSCLDIDTATCQMNNKQELTYGSIERMLDYVCGAGETALNRNDKCWIRHDIENGISQCEVEYYFIFNQLDSNNQTCNTLNTLKKCLLKTVLPCGNDAQNIIASVFERYFRNLREHIECNPQDEANHASQITKLRFDIIASVLAILYFLNILS